MNEPLTCQHCGVTALPIVVKSGPHLKALCSSCNSYIKFLPQGRPVGEFVLYFGKHSGKALCLLAQEKGGMDYLRWLADLPAIADGLAKAQIKVREYLATTDKGIA